MDKHFYIMITTINDKVFFATPQALILVGLIPYTGHLFALKYMYLTYLTFYKNMCLTYSIRVFKVIFLRKNMYLTLFIRVSTCRKKKIYTKKSFYMSPLIRHFSTPEGIFDIILCFCIMLKSGSRQL